MHDTGACHRFDAFCKTVLRREMWTHYRDEARRRKRETTFSALAAGEMEQFGLWDVYPSDHVVFSAFDCDLPIQDERLATAFAGLPPRERQILILHCVLTMKDGEIGTRMGMSRSAVQRHRAKTLRELRNILTYDGGKHHGRSDF